MEFCAEFAPYIVIFNLDLPLTVLSWFQDGLFRIQPIMKLNPLARHKFKPEQLTAPSPVLFREMDWRALNEE